MSDKMFYTHEEMLDKYVGKKGCVERDIYDDDLLNELIGKRFTEYRKQHNLTISDIAKTTGVSRKSISRLENDSGSISLATLTRVFVPLGLRYRFDIYEGEG